MSSQFLGSTVHSISWLYNRHLANELVIKPDFQRNPVWSSAQKSYLIDTILRGYPIPELYFQALSDAEGKETHIVVDGQQRVRACLEFIAGEFSLEGDAVQEFEGLTFANLTKSQRETVFNYKFVIRDLPQMDDPEIRAIFARINRNVMNLNNQELRHATYWGQFIKLMEELADNAVWVDLRIFTPNDVRRMLDVEFISELAIAYLHGLQNKKDTLEEWYRTYETGFDETDSLRRRFNSTLEELRVVLAEHATRFRKKSDFYTLFLALADERTSLPLSSDERRRVSSELLKFGSEVDAAIKETGQVATRDDAVGKYARAVQKAASDRSNRRARAEALASHLGIPTSGSTSQN